MKAIKVILLVTLLNTTLNVRSDVKSVEPEDRILVIADPIKTEIEQKSGSHIVIPVSKNIRENYKNVAQVLKTVPGLEVLNQGGAGKVSTLFVRGTNSEHTLVLIDGIEVNDPISPTRSFDFSRTNLNEVGKWALNKILTTRRRFIWFI